MVGLVRTWTFLVRTNPTKLGTFSTGGLRTHESSYNLSDSDSEEEDDDADDILSFRPFKKENNKPIHRKDSRKMKKKLKKKQP